MSHFTSIKTRMTEKVHLLKALEDLGHSPQDGLVEIRGYMGNRTAVEIKIATENPEYDIGFRKVGGAYQCVADWYGLREFNQQKFIEKLTQRYAYHAARAKLEAQGFTLASEQVHEDGRIHLVLRRVT